MKQNKSSRRGFIKKVAGSALVGLAPSVLSANPDDKHFVLQPEPNEKRQYGSNDQVNVAVIGMGIMGFNNAETTVQIPGVKLVGACDLYTGRLDHAKEVYGKDLLVTKDYREILERKDVDAVIIATSDHWHDHISIEAMNKGKHVYCEKQMVHQLGEGAAEIGQQKKTGKVFQVGIQNVMSIDTQKASNIFDSGVTIEIIFIINSNYR